MHASFSWLSSIQGPCVLGLLRGFIDWIKIISGLYMSIYWLVVSFGLSSFSGHHKFHLFHSWSFHLVIANSWLVHSWLIMCLLILHSSLIPHARVLDWLVICAIEDFPFKSTSFPFKSTSFSSISFSIPWWIIQWPLIHSIVIIHIHFTAHSSF